MATIKKVWNGNTLTVALQDGESVLESFTFDAGSVTPDVHQQAARFGFGTKIGNFGALPQGTPERDRFEAMRKGAEQLTTVGWKAARAEGEEGGGDTEMEYLARAAAQVLGMSEAEALAFIKAAKPAERTQLRKDKEIATALAAIRPEQPAAQSLKERMKAMAAGQPLPEVTAEPEAPKSGRKGRKGEQAEG